MPRTFYAIERLGHEDLRAFKIAVPEIGEQGFHRQLSSYVSFRKREIARTWPHPTKTSAPKNHLYYYLFSEQDYKSQVHAFEMAFRDLLENTDENYLLVNNYLLPCTTVSSIYDFYEAVGYVYSKRQWAPASERRQCKDNPAYRAALIEACRGRRRKPSSRLDRVRVAVLGDAPAAVSNPVPRPVGTAGV